MERPIRVLYVTGLWHSGSTLLDLLVSSHPEAVGVGEVQYLNAGERERCACGARPPTACPFWREVDAALRAAHGLGLADLALHPAGPAPPPEHERWLFEAVAAVSGRRAIVDSSKDVRRLARLLAVPGLAVHPVHLVRSPFGVVHSKLRKGRSVARESALYASVVLQTRRLLRGRPHRRIAYEALCRDPERALRPLMGDLGLAFDPAQLEWAGRERHNVGGNRTRFSRSSAIRLDESWRTGLSLRQKAVVACVAAPGSWLPPSLHPVLRRLAGPAAGRTREPDDGAVPYSAAASARPSDDAGKAPSERVKT